jgi:type IX secretion system PorP/SprF family membrane protein
MKTKHIKLQIILMALLFGLNIAKAQYDAMFTQYMFNEMFINPAYAGSKDAMSTTLLHRQQWLNFPGRPVTTSFSLHGPLMGSKMGLGLSVLNEKIGVLNRNLVYATYAYRIQTSAKGKLAFGLMAGLHNQVNRFADLKTTDVGDIQVAQNSPSTLAPNFGTGIYYNTDKFYAGFSIPRMIDDRVTFDAQGDAIKNIGVSPNRFHYYLTAGYMFTISESLKLKPQAMIKAVQNAPLQYEVNVNALIIDKIWAGLGYRSNASAVGLLGAQITPQLVASYSYDYGINEIQKYSQGSHELAISYLFSFKGRKVTSPRYF